MTRKILLALAVAVATVTAYAQSSSPPNSMPRGTAALPGFYVLGDRNTGVYSPGADQLSISSGGVEQVKFHAGTVFAYIDGIWMKKADGLGFPYIQIESSQNNGVEALYLVESYATGKWGELSYNNTGGALAGTFYLAAGSGTANGISVKTVGAAPIAFSTTNTERARFAADGSLLVGTTTDDTELLKVAGAAEITGALTLGGDVTTSGSTTTLGGTTVNITATNLQRSGSAAGLPRTFTAVYDPANLAPGTSRCDNVTVTGITTSGGAVSANIGATDPVTGCVVASVRASAANTVRICWQNAWDAVNACDTASSTWTFTQAQ